LEISLHKLLKIYEKNVDVFITPSQFLQRKLAEYSIDGTVIHVPNFVDLQRFQPGAEPANYFVFFGRLTRIKGVLTLMEAMRDVKSSYLYMVGQGELEDSLRSYAQRHGIHNVEFLGHLATQDLIPVIQRAAFTVVPSEWYENYPMTILESFACGTPVIGSRLGGIPELVDDGENGLLFDAGHAQELADRIRSLLDDPSKVKAMGQSARQKVERVNNRQDHYRSTIAIYERLLGNAAGGEKPL
jgi:glycosyltransferase involved in cell wall biosynthesis